LIEERGLHGFEWHVKHADVVDKHGNRIHDQVVSVHTHMQLRVLDSVGQQPLVANIVVAGRDLQDPVDVERRDERGLPGDPRGYGPDVMARLVGRGYICEGLFVHIGIT
jgi:hypothetical protein